MAGTTGKVSSVTKGLKTFVRAYDEGTISQTTSLPRGHGAAETSAPLDAICNLASLAEHGEIAPTPMAGR
jgi:hypothetical protein